MKIILTRDFKWLTSLVLDRVGAVVALIDLTLDVDLDVCVTCAERVCK